MSSVGRRRAVGQWLGSVRVRSSLLALFGSRNAIMGTALDNFPLDCVGCRFQIMAAIGGYRPRFSRDTRSSGNHPVSGLLAWPDRSSGPAVRHTMRRLIARARADRASSPRRAIEEEPLD